MLDNEDTSGADFFFSSVYGSTVLASAASSATVSSLSPWSRLGGSCGDGRLSLIIIGHPYIFFYQTKYF
jgi:hypothetical protein